MNLTLRFPVANGANFQNALYACAFAAQRKFNEAMKILASGKLSGTGSFDIIDAGTPIAMAVDQGNWSRAGELLKVAQAKAALLDPRIAGRYEGMGLSLHALDGTPPKSQINALSNYLASEETALASATLADRAELKFHIMLAAYLAARAGDTKLAGRALAAAGPESEADTPVLDNLRGVAQAEITRVSGKPQDALATLKPLVNGSELYLTHVALMDAYTDAHDPSAALREAHWLSSHRGQAYLEFNVQQVLTPFNVALSDLALLRAAKLSRTLGERNAAGKSLGAFLDAWPQAAQLTWLTPSLRSLQSIEVKH